MLPPGSHSAEAGRGPGGLGRWYHQRLDERRAERAHGADVEKNVSRFLRAGGRSSGSSLEA